MVLHFSPVPRGALVRNPRLECRHERSRGEVGEGQSSHYHCRAPPLTMGTSDSTLNPPLSINRS